MALAHDRSGFSNSGTIGGTIAARDRHYYKEAVLTSAATRHNGQA